MRAAQALSPARFEVAIGPRAILLDGVEIAPLPQDTTHGLDRAYKRSGPNDLHISPLADAIARKRGDAASGDLEAARIEVSPDVAYRVFTEVGFTLGEVGVSVFHLVAPSSGGDVPRGTLGEIVTRSARRRAESASLGGVSAGPLNFTVILVADGISIKGRGGNVKPGCSDVGPGLALPKGNGGYLFQELTKCAARIKASAPGVAGESSVTVLALPDVPFRDVMSAIDAVRGDRRELFPDVVFGVAR